MAARSAGKYAVRYGPHAVALWKVAGPHVEAAARRRMDEASARRSAFDHAGSLTDGAVLRVLDAGRPVFVVLSGDEPVSAYPEADKPLTALVEKADLGARVTPAEHREARLRTRAASHLPGRRTAPTSP